MERLHWKYGIFQCLTCHDIFPTKSVLTAHTKIHEAVRKAGGAEGGVIAVNLMDNSSADSEGDSSAIRPICPSVFCKQNFPTEAQLARHVTKEHALPKNYWTNASVPKQTNASVPKTEKTWSYECHVCPKKFVRNDWFEQHLLSHGEDTSKPYQCQTCFKRYSRPSALASHQKTHSSEDYFRCFICQEKFDSLKESKRHGATHRNEEDGKFHCIQCSNVYDSFDAIRQHCRLVKMSDGRTAVRPYIILSMKA